MPMNPSIKRFPDRLVENLKHRAAVISGLSPYDAAHLHLARSLNCPLATFDEQLARAAR